MDYDFEEFFGKGWYEVLKDKIEELNISLKLETIRRRRMMGYVIYPESIPAIFQVFKNLQPDDIKVVIIGQDPYHDGSYCGRAFGNSKNKVSLSPSLANIFKEVDDDIYNGLKLDHDVSLEEWENQGVFLINTTLTVEKGNPGSHKRYEWDRLVRRAIYHLYTEKRPKVFLCWGKHAQEVLNRGFSNELNLILTAPHPSPFSAHKGFFGCRHFSKTNKYLIENGLKEIKW